VRAVLFRLPAVLLFNPRRSGGWPNNCLPTARADAQPQESPEREAKGRELPPQRQQQPPPAADGRAEGGPEPAVHVELVPERRAAGRQAQTAPEVRLQHGAAAEAVRVIDAPPAGLER